MIVSASYRTDIPAFYGRWFLARLAAGFCRVANPYGGRPGLVRLDPASVDGFVFWTRRLAPFLPALDAVAAQGTPFVVQHTAIGYPRAIDAAVADPAAAIAAMRAARERHGARAVVWRYDPVLVSDITPPAWHRENFRSLAASLAGATDEATVSFAQFYRKSRRNLDAAGRVRGFAWREPAEEEKRALLAELSGIAAGFGMHLTLCTQPALAGPGMEAARCIDPDRLSDVAGRPVAARMKGNRPGCLCAESRDIGAYDSCAQGCAYCYAVVSRAAAKRRLAAHDPAAELLVPEGA